MTNPLISCLLLTNDRRKYLPVAIHSYLSQTYNNKELVIIDNGKEEDRDLFQESSMKYFRVEPGIYNHGQLLNIGCEHCQGDMVAVWDSDDWYASTRLEDQLRMIEGYAVAGYSRLYFYEVETRKCYTYTGPEWYGAGTTQMFTKEFWRNNNFMPLRVGADGRFATAAYKLNLIKAKPGLGMTVARAHRDSTAPPMWRAINYNVVAMTELPKEFRNLIGEN